MGYYYDEVMSYRLLSQSSAIWVTVNWSTRLREYLLEDLGLGFEGCFPSSRAEAMVRLSLGFGVEGRF